MTLLDILDRLNYSSDSLQGAVTYSKFGRHLLSDTSSNTASKIRSAINLHAEPIGKTLRWIRPEEVAENVGKNGNAHHVILRNQVFDITSSSYS